VFANYLIGLREGLEASLVIGILVAYLVKTGHRDRLRSIWAGSAIAVVISLAFGGLLTLTSRSLSPDSAHAFAGAMSVLAVGLVTWMVFWMRRAAREMRGELHGRIDRAIGTRGVALALVALVAVLREGLETALFLWATTSDSTGPVVALVGALLGIATAIAIGWGVYRGALSLNLATFFTWTGALLIVVAAGVLAYGIGDLQESRILPGDSSRAFDVSSSIDAHGPVGTLLGGFFHFDPITTWLQLTSWVIYLGVTLILYLRTQRPSPVASPRVRDRTNA